MVGTVDFRNSPASDDVTGQCLMIDGGMIMMQRAHRTQVALLTDSLAARDIWQAHSALLQAWNSLRTLVSGLSLRLIGLAYFFLGRENP